MAEAVTNLPAKVLNKERRSDGKFRKWTATNNTGRSPKRSLSQRRRAAREEAFDKAITPEEFYRICVSLRNRALYDGGDAALASLQVQAAKLIIEHELGKPRVHIDVEHTSTVSIEERIVLAKVAAQMIPAPELPALPEPIIDAEVVETCTPQSSDSCSGSTGPTSPSANPTSGT